MRVVTDRPDLVAEWVAGQIGAGRFIPPYSAIGFEDLDGKPKGGVVFNACTGADVEITVAGLWTKGMFRVISWFAFDQLGVNRITAHVRPSNKKVANVMRLAGFQAEGTVREYYHDREDATLMGMLKAECRWR